MSSLSLRDWDSIITFCTISIWQLRSNRAVTFYGTKHYIYNILTEKAWSPSTVHTWKGLTERKRDRGRHFKMDSVDLVNWWILSSSVGPMGAQQQRSMLHWSWTKADTDTNWIVVVSGYTTWECVCECVRVWLCDCFVNLCVYTHTKKRL